MTIKKNKSLASVKKTLKQILPNKIDVVLKSYENFLDNNVPQDPKGFTAHHNACKSAVSHVETLFKLSQWTEPSQVTSHPLTTGADFLKILEEAEQEHEEDQ